MDAFIFISQFFVFTDIYFVLSLGICFSLNRWKIQGRYKIPSVQFYCTCIIACVILNFQISSFFISSPSTLPNHFQDLCDFYCLCLCDRCCITDIWYIKQLELFEKARKKIFYCLLFMFMMCMYSEKKKKCKAKSNMYFSCLDTALRLTLHLCKNSSPSRNCRIA